MLTALMAKLSLYRKDKWSRNSFLISVAIHGGLILAAVSIVAIRTLGKPDPEFTSYQRPKMQPRELKMQVKPEKQVKASAMPRPAARLVAMTPSAVSMPEIKTPDVKAMRMSRDTSSMARSGFGSGMFGDYGSGFGDMGAMVDLFGMRSQGKHIVYLVDYSLSTQKFHDDVVEELQRSIQALPFGVKVSVMFFAGPVWFPGEVATGDKKGKVTNKSTGETFEWVMGKEQWELKEGGYPRAKWTTLTPQSKQDLLEAVAASPLGWGTDWRPGFEMAFALNPRPDVIFFITDGIPQLNNEDAVVEFLKKTNVPRMGKRTIINAIGVGNPKMEEQMMQLAGDTGGNYQILESTQIKGNKKAETKKQDPVPKVQRLGER